ncbi:hypothetical protein NitYY0826_C1393 [Nitratiruptor sp. YY08-26]|nr:hypothetical protein NitYY0813_C1391 [Nitratiruptor sp. YY08-13]BCD66451.1 hypothetical protein NitYY0826_C1393 [Nitratiruptor sp. YY08-26]
MLIGSVTPPLFQLVSIAPSAVATYPVHEPSIFDEDADEIYLFG